MEYILNYYKQKTWINLHVKKRKNTERYVKCIIFRKGCKSKAKLNQDIHKISLSSQHHGRNGYKDGIYSIKRACKVSAKFSGENIQKIFNDQTSVVPACRKNYFVNCVHTSRNYIWNSFSRVNG